jgi:ABC-type transport system substrate-binding protein/tRNA A-37 threonylcarbamoyl transferase component Bud32
MTDLTGKQIGQYQIQQEIGHGGMATVYKATQTTIGREVAIKVLPPQFLQDRTFLDRFNREVQVIAQLQHPRILPVHDFGEFDGIPYIVMAYMAGGTLADRIPQGSMPLDESVRLIGQIAEGLDHAHMKGIIHRDFKPSNVLLDEYGNSYLADFGIAKVSQVTVQITGTGMVVGTPAYMAPEMFERGDVTPTVDQYALGITLYQMLTGRLPFLADTPLQYINAHANKPVPNALAIRPDLSPGIQTVIERALAKSSNWRYPNVGAMAQTLASAASGAHVQPLPAEAARTEPVVPTPPPAPLEAPTIDVPPSPPAVPAQVAPPPRTPTPQSAPRTASPVQPPRRGPRSGVIVGGLLAAGVAAVGIGALVVMLATGRLDIGGASGESDVPPSRPDSETDDSTAQTGDDSAQPEEEAVAEEERTVIIGTTDQISSLDFADAYSIHDWELFRNTNLGLVGFEPGTANVSIEHGTASSFSISDDGLTYVFELEDSWRYPDGTQLVAGDYVRGIERALTLDGDVSGLVSSYVAGVEAPDDRTVIIHLFSPRGDFMQIVSSTAYMPVPPGAYPDNELNRFPSTVYGVGPWQIVDYNVEEQVLLERNPNYKHGFSGNAPHRVIIRYLQDPLQMAIAVENGEIDIAWRLLGLSEAFRLGDVSGLTAFNSGGGGIRYLVPNHDMPPFDDRNVRQALAYLVNREEIIDRAMQGLADPLYSQVAPGMLGANVAFLDVYGSGVDIGAAEALLAEAGYTPSNPLEFDLWYPLDHYGAHVAEVFQILEEQFESTSYIRVNLQTQEWGTYVSALTSCEYQIGYLGWIYDYPDPSNYLEPFAQSEAAQFIGTCYESNHMDNLLRAGGEATNADERANIYNEAQYVYADDVVTIPLIMETEYAVYRDDTIDNIVIGPAFYFRYDLIEMR